VVAASLAITLVAGFSFAQWPTPSPRPNLDVIAAQDALEEAMRHLQQARSPNTTAITRAKAFIALAHTELAQAGGVQGLRTNSD
jgi:hypothetical protein